MTYRTQQTVRELTPAIGEQVAVRFEDLTFDCTVIDAKNSYGKVRLLVQPIKGIGTQWIELGRLQRYAPATQEARERAEMESLVARGSSWPEARYGQAHGLLNCQKGVR